MINYTDFYNEHYSGAPKSFRRTFDNLIKCFDEVTHGRASKAEIISKYDVVGIYNNFGDYLGKTQCSVARGILVDLYDWLYKTGQIQKNRHDFISSISLKDIINGMDFKRYYRATLCDLLDTIECLGSEGLKTSNYVGYELLGVKVLCILVWYGLEAKDASVMTNEHIIPSEMSIINPGTKEIIVLPSDIFKYVEALQESNHIYYLKTGTYRECRPTNRLFKSAIAPGLNAQSLSAMVGCFNNITKGKFMLNIRLVRINSQYASVYEKMRGVKRSNTENYEKILCNAISSVLKTDDLPTVFRFRQYYNRWVAVFCL